MKYQCLLLIIALLALTGCDTLFPVDLIPTSESLVTETLPLQTPGLTPTSIHTPTPSGPLTLKLWLPPQFNPDSGTPTGNALKSRLLQFSRDNPEIFVDVRIKDVDGAGGLLDTLTTASTAAQSALPDLVILPHDHLETAVSEGLLYPFDNLSVTLDDPDWYNFAREMAYVQDKTYGLPIAADALIQAYRSEIVESPVFDSTSVLTATSPLIFPAADPRALYPLALYLSEGGRLLDEQNRPILDADILTGVLSFFQQANNAGSMPYWLTGYQQDEQAWEAFLESRGDQTITWLSRYLTNAALDDSVAMAPIPTINGKEFSLTGGWVWALTSPDPSHHPASVQLAEFLTEGDFLSEWTATMDLLPTRPSALRAWDERDYSWIDPDFIAELDSIAKSLEPYPSKTLSHNLSRVLEKATVDILKGQTTPEEAARNAADEME
jgi:multiple sugar transport system substrate-binding protein